MFTDSGLVFIGSPPPPSRAPPSSPDMHNGGPPTYSNGVPAVPEKDHSSSQKSLAANIVRRKLTGYVGFANLPNQWHRKSVRKGFNFNVMVVGTVPLYPSFRPYDDADRFCIGESGLGKSTLVNTLFNASLYAPRNGSGPTSVEVPQTVNISAISADIEENGVRLRLNVVDTPGFGDFVNNEDR